MIDVVEARRRASERLTSRLATWATEPPDSPTFTIALKPPTERAALDDQAGAQQWVRAWHDSTLPAGAYLQWEERSWSRLGRQRLPVRLVLETPDTVAAFIGGDLAKRWRGARSRVDELRDRLGTSSALDVTTRRHAATLLHGDPTTFERVIAVVAWLGDHDITGMRPRQIPVRGMDSKWFSAHRSVVLALHTARAGDGAVGIVDADATARVRILDPNLHAGGPFDFSAPASELAALDLSPAVVFVFENLETVLAMPPWSNAVVAHGGGYAVDIVAALPWVQRAPVVYWGDLDSHGFAILHRLRSHHDRAVSVLMDEQTLLEHRDLWVPEPSPNRGAFTSLTPAETATLARLGDEGDVRLEQERIPWTSALSALRLASRPSTLDSSGQGSRIAQVFHDAGGFDLCADQSSMASDPLDLA